MKKTCNYMLAGFTLASVVSAEIITEDNFDSRAVGVNATTFGSNWTGGQRNLYLVANDPAIFGGSNYLAMESRPTAFSFVNNDVVSHPVATVSFDLIVPDAVGDTAYLRVSVSGDNSNIHNRDIGIEGTAGVEHGIAADTKVHVDIIANTTDLAIDYEGFTINSESVSWFIDGAEVFSQNGSGTNATVERFGLWMNSPTTTESDTFYLDNFVIRDVPFVAKDAELSQLGDGLDFGDLFHPSPTDESSLTATYQNIGLSESITIDGISLTNTGSGVYSLVTAPANGTVVAPGDTFDVEVKATGGDGVVAGEISIDVSHAGDPANDQDRLDPITADIAVVAPPASFSHQSVAGYPKVLAGESKASFTVFSTGLGSSSLEITSADVNPLLSIISPTLPVTIAAGDSMVFEVEVADTATPGAITDTLTLNTTDPDSAAQVVDVRFSVFASNSVVLVDFDDGIANGVHEASVRNGGFEEGMDMDSFADTPAWATKTGNNSQAQSTEQLVFAADPATGTLHAETGSWRNPGRLFIPVHDLLPADWTLEEGDYFTVEYKWKAGLNFDPAFITSNSVMFGQNADGTVIGALADRPFQVESTTTQTTDYNMVSFDSTPLSAGHATLGLGFRFLLECGDSNALPVPNQVFSLIDDVTLIGHFGVEPAGDLTLESVSFAAPNLTITTSSVTDGGTYHAAYSPDLATAFVPVAGSEQTAGSGQVVHVINVGSNTEGFYRIVEGSLP